MKTHWWRVLHPARWRSLVLLILCFCASMVVYRSILITKSISNSLQVRNQLYDRLLNDSSGLPLGQQAYCSSMLENECKFPSLLPWENDLAKTSKIAGPITCTKNMPNLVTLDEENVLSIHDDLDERWRRKKAEIKCKLWKLTGGLKPKNQEMQEELIDIILYPNTRTKIDYDQFVVRCFETVKAGKNETNKEEIQIFQRPFAGYAKQEKSLARSTPKQPSVIVLVMDSTSRNQFLRHAPKSWKYMNELGFITLTGYNKIGDNSGVNLFPIVAGKTPETHVGGDGREVLRESEKPVEHEKYEHLWDIFKRRNCVTMINDDIMHHSRGLFAYHFHRGFTKPPTDYYFRPFEIFNVKNQIRPKLGQCTEHGESVMAQHFDLFEKFTRVYKDYCHFSFNFFTTLTHDNSYHLEAVDDQIRGALETFQAIGAMNNTAVVIMGDHGNRIGVVQYSYSGRIEERAPFFSIYLPEGFRKAHPELERNYRINANRLTSNYDIHRTLKELALGVEEDRDASKYRGYNLFRELVPTTRNCTDAGIPENFCLCMTQDALPKIERDSNKFKVLVDALNVKLSEYECLDNRTMNIEEDLLKTFALSDMARKGMRNVPKDKAEYPPKMFKEHRYIYTHVTIASKTGQQHRLLFEVKLYSKAETMKVISAPLVLTDTNQSSTMSVDDICRTTQ